MIQFMSGASFLLKSMEQYRAKRLAMGLPFCGRLEQSYREIYDSLSLLKKDNLDFDDGTKQLEEALKSMDKLGRFLNVEVGPGDRTIRDALLDQDRKRDTGPRESFLSEDEEPTVAESLQQVTQYLGLSVGREQPQLFDLWHDNEPKAAQQPQAPELPERADRVLRQKLLDLRRSVGYQVRLRIVSELFGARIAAGATRNDKSHLEETAITESQVKANAEMLRKNPLFLEFVDKEEEELVRLAQKRGHGGLLETRFEKFLLKLPGGKLRNDPILARYMPSCKDRIKVLKKQAEESGSWAGASDPMAEIVVIRGLVHADRHRVLSLEQAIPTDPSSTLSACSEILGNQSDFMRCVETAMEAAQHGHGGRMLEQMRAKEKEIVHENIGGGGSEFTKIMLNKTTYAGRMDELRVKAFLLLEQIKRGRAVDDQVKKEYRALALENFGLSDLVNTDKQPSASDVDEYLVREKGQILGESDRFSEENALLLRDQDVKGGLNAIVNSKGVSYQVPNFFPLRLRQVGKAEPGKQGIEAEKGSEPSLL